MTKPISLALTNQQIAHVSLSFKRAFRFAFDWLDSHAKRIAALELIIAQQDARIRQLEQGLFGVHDAATAIDAMCDAAETRDDR